MRLNINLASLKYEDVRRFYIGWGAALAVLAVLALLETAFAYVQYSRVRAASQQTRSLQQKIDALEKERERMVDIGNRPENRDVTQQKKYWNKQITKRSFSWTQLLNDMQKIMPSRAYLRAVQPELTQDNRLKLQMTITGEKRDDARELQKRMENSARFNDPRIEKEDVDKETKPGLPPTFRFEVVTFYTPTVSAPSVPTLSPPHKQRSQASRAARRAAPEAL
jgi:type IV pilus assembly protein PilN